MSNNNDIEYNHYFLPEKVFRVLCDLCASKEAMAHRNIEIHDEEVIPDGEVPTLIIEDCIFWIADEE